MHGRGQPEHGRTVQAADVGIVEWGGGIHVEPDSEVEVSVGARRRQREGSGIGGVFGDVLCGEGAKLAEEAAVGVDLVGIVEVVGHLEPEGLGGVFYVHAEAIPGVAAEIGIACAGPAGEPLRRGESPGWNFQGPVRAAAALPRVIVWIDVWGEVWPEEVVAGDWAAVVTAWEKAKGQMGSTTSRTNPNFRIVARVSLARE
jgi:hypothetical protein